MFHHHFCRMCWIGSQAATEVAVIWCCMMRITTGPSPDEWPRNKHRFCCRIGGTAHALSANNPWVSRGPLWLKVIGKLGPLVEGPEMWRDVLMHQVSPEVSDLFWRTQADGLTPDKGKGTPEEIRTEQGSHFSTSPWFCKSSSTNLCLLLWIAKARNLMSVSVCVWLCLCLCVCLSLKWEYQSPDTMVFTPKSLFNALHWLTHPDPDWPITKEEESPVTCPEETIRKVFAANAAGDEEAAAIAQLHSIAAGLLNTGYYARFFKEDLWVITCETCEWNNTWVTTCDNFWRDGVASECSLMHPIIGCSNLFQTSGSPWQFPH